MKIIKLVLLTFISMIATNSILLAQNANQIQEVEITKTIAVKVKGVTCSTDLKTISANVEKLEGVSSCKTGKKGVTSTFKIKMNPSLVTEEEIHAAIENTGGCKNPNDRPYKVKQ